MAKIAVHMKRPVDEPEGVKACVVATGDGWTVNDVVCSRGPRDRRFEEQHDRFVIAIVTSGTFQYHRSGADHEEMLTPGSLLLGSPGQCFECGHEHGVGDRCLAFHFGADYFNAVTEGRNMRTAFRSFRSTKLSPVRALSPLITDACAALSGSPHVSWEELAIRLAARVFQIDEERKTAPSAAPPAAIARISDSVRLIERQRDSNLTLVRLAAAAGLSPFHFLRTFEIATGTTPHQYMLRTRLRAAAIRLTSDTAKIVDVAFDAGFGDVSNFNRAFRTEFGVSPTTYRRRQR